VKKLLLAAALALAPMTALAASSDWTINAAFDSMGVKFTTTCHLDQDAGGKLSGTCIGSAQEKTVASGAVATGTDGKPSYNFGYDTTYDGTPVHLEYVGSPQADGSLAGTISTGGPQGTFTATRK